MNQHQQTSTRLFRWAIRSGVSAITLATIVAPGVRSTMGASPNPKPRPSHRLLPAAQWQSAATGVTPTAVALADLNGDGRIDLVMVNQGRSPNYATAVRVLLGRGDGTFAEGIDSMVTGSPQALAVGDFNGDGKADLAIADAGKDGDSSRGYDGTVGVMLGNGDGTFQRRADYATGHGPGFPCSVAVGDFNGDGKADLVVANGGMNTDHIVSVLLGNGDGTFQNKTSHRVDGNPFSLIACDFNGDGRCDLAMASEDADWVSIILGNGDGTFQASRHYKVDGHPTSMALGDLNGDGRADLVSANHSGNATGALEEGLIVEAGNTLSVLLGNGDGTFQRRSDYNADLSPFYVVAGDFDGDGKCDLLSANTVGSNRGIPPTRGSLSILLGRGDGTFRDHVDLGSRPPRRIGAGDLNGDGASDLVTVGGSGEKTVDILLGPLGRTR